MTLSRLMAQALTLAVMSDPPLVAQALLPVVLRLTSRQEGTPFSLRCFRTEHPQ